MIAYSFREVRPAIDRGFNEVMKWMAAARWSGLRLLFPTCVDAVLGGQQIAAQLFAVIGQSNVTS